MASQMPLDSFPADSTGFLTVEAGDLGPPRLPAARVRTVPFEVTRTVDDREGSQNFLVATRPFRDRSSAQRPSSRDEDGRPCQLARVAHQKSPPSTLTSDQLSAARELAAASGLTIEARDMQAGLGVDLANQRDRCGHSHWPSASWP